MRFHIGFSKRISIKKLIEIIGFLFVACLTFFGIYDTTHAWERINYGSFSGRDIEFFDNSTNKLDISACGGGVTTNSIFMQNLGSYCLWYDQYATNKYRLGGGGYNYSNGMGHYYKIFNVATSKGYLDTYSIDEVYTDTYSLKFNNGSTPYCPNNTDTPKSINFKFRFDTTSYGTDYDFFNISSDIQEQIALTMTAFDDSSGSDVPFTTTCSYESISGGRYQVYCNNVFSGTDSHPITRYSINFVNISPFNNRYSSSTEEKSITYNIYLTYAASSSSNYDYTLQYECSDDPPVFDPICVGYNCVDDDPAGLNDIYDKIKNNYNTSINGIDLLDPPVDYLSLINLPFAIFNAVIDSNDATCTPYELDFSSIMRKWGDSNSSYILHLPCMRDTIENIIGSNLFALIDTLICFYLIYKICMFIVRMVSAVLSGEDLFEFYFGRSEKNSKE